MQANSLNLSDLSPVERIALADVLYDSAMQEIEAATPMLTDEQLAELDRRIAAIESRAVEPLPWDKVHMEPARDR